LCKRRVDWLIMSNCVFMWDFKWEKFPKSAKIPLEGQNLKNRNPIITKGYILSENWEAQGA